MYSGFPAASRSKILEAITFMILIDPIQNHLAAVQAAASSSCS
jgi:hypothetical protein